MKRQVQAHEALTTSWSWPVDLTRYDRNPKLYAVENEAFDRVCNRSKEGARRSPITRLTHRQLQRLIIPIHDCLDVTGANRFARAAVTSVLLREMERRRTSLWAWTREEWVKTLCSDGNVFKKLRKAPNSCRLDLMATAYLLGDVTEFHGAGRFSQRRVANKVFGRQLVEEAVRTVIGVMNSWGVGNSRAKFRFPSLVAELLLANRSPLLADLTPEVLEAARQGKMAARLKDTIIMLSKALTEMGVLPNQLAPGSKSEKKIGARGAFTGVPEEWREWCLRWRKTTTLARQTYDRVYYSIQKVGRWLADQHPEITSPAQWTREIAAEYVAAVDRMTVGQYSYPNGNLREKLGKPFTPRSKDSTLASVRTFFQDLQEWNWIPRRFNPGRALATPRSIRNLISPDPRVIADDMWAKLLHAGLNITAEDLPVCAFSGNPPKPMSWYPIEMVRAVTNVWLFAGLRSDEIIRLRVGCIRWQREDVVIAPTEEMLPQNAVCLLDVPTNKTNTAFTKPVDPVVGNAVAVWEQGRPSQPLALDQKTGEMVHYLFSYRGQRLGRNYLNDRVIPLLCNKAGVPESDARGAITSHRARSTLATQLYNAKNPMTLFELMEWLGHRSPATTQHYAKVTPTKLAKAYADADYFKRNVRTIEVLIDRDAILNGAAAKGAPWRYFDLGHGYCTYDYFAHCPHRMACAKCSFYVPKDSSRAQMIEAASNLQRMLQEIPLTEEEIAAVEAGIEFMSKLCEKLTDVPTPAGQTPRELRGGGGRELPVLSKQSTA